MQFPGGPPPYGAPQGFMPPGFMPPMGYPGMPPMAPPPKPRDPNQSTTVYVGGLGTTDDDYVRRLLEQCGSIIRWKRTVDPNTDKVKGFGFCEFDDAEGVLRALRILNNFKLTSEQDEKGIMINMDDKTKAYLQTYQKQKYEELNEALLSKVLSENVTPEEQAEDEQVLTRLKDMREVQKTRGNVLEIKETELIGAQIAGTLVDKEKATLVCSEISAFRKRTLERDMELKEKLHERELEKERQLAAQKQDRERDYERRERQRLERIEQQFGGRIPEVAPAPRKDRSPPPPVRPRDEELEASLRQVRREQAAEASREAAPAAARKPVVPLSPLTSPEHANPASISNIPAATLAQPAPSLAPVPAPIPPPVPAPAPVPVPVPAAVPTMGPEEGEFQEEDFAHQYGSFSSAPEPAKKEKAPPAQAAMRVPMTQVFGIEDDDATALGGAGGSDSDARRKRPIIPIDYDEDNVKPTGAPRAGTPPQVAGMARPTATIEAVDELHGKSKDAVFATSIRWDLVAKNDLVNTKLRGWIAKKIKEFLGEEDLELINFICERLNAQTSPQSLLEQIAQVLDEEAEPFVLKLWQLLLVLVRRLEKA
ncbi:putative RNA-binding protein 25 [Paratrimastix pyriformis]|uniref:RNA-binding protein 25 n=1 Tax=Paratrimastix pyriformis TaxID=342808 RepID=A0ABQ8U8Z2_9EUKA|nr:putative RNA-binding protein 25 [Paratrimastix pyriformis]